MASAAIEFWHPLHPWLEMQQRVGAQGPEAACYGDNMVWFVGQEIYVTFLPVLLIYCDTLRSHFTELSFYPGFYTEGNCSTTNSGIFCHVSQ